MDTTSSSQPVTYDAYSFTVRGKRKLLISGEFHYARTPRETWASILDHSKALGINCIGCYVFWNFHEPEPGQFDFEGDADLSYFLELCAERELDVVVRMGPYCCAEWNYGGFPPWLRDMPGMVIRTWNEPYMDRVRIYFEKLTEVIRPHLATQGGPIILCQVENEYNNVADRYGEAGQRYLGWMSDLAIELGIDLPTIMCEGADDRSIETLNGFSIPESRMLEFREENPDMPMFWTELWPAWYDTWSYQTHRRDAKNIAIHVLNYVAHGGSGWNYYMWYGGTNFARTAMYLQTTSYGFDAPIDEFGKPSIKGEYLGKLHHILLEYQDFFFHGEVTKTITEAGYSMLWRFAGNKLLLVVTPGKAVLSHDDKVVFDSQVGWDETTKQRDEKPWESSCQLDQWKSIPEPMPGDRQDGVVSEQPIEQLELTQDQSDYCWYSTNFEQADFGQANITIPYGGDMFYIYLDGELVAQSERPFHENRGPTRPVETVVGGVYNMLEDLVKDGFRHTFTFDADKGTHRLDLLAVSLGMIKGDWQVSDSMQTERKGIWMPVEINGQQAIGWTMTPCLQYEKQALSDWQTTNSQAKGLRWLETTFDMDSAVIDGNIDIRLDAMGLGKGMVWVNGKMLGRYWLIEGEGYGADESWHPKEENALSLDPEGQPTQRYYRIPASWLESTNTLRLFEEQAIDLPKLQIEVRK